jgi:hypothetical protein
MPAGTVSYKGNILFFFFASLKSLKKEVVSGVGSGSGSGSISQRQLIRTKITDPRHWFHLRKSFGQTFQADFFPAKLLYLLLLRTGDPPPLQWCSCSPRPAGWRCPAQSRDRKWFRIGLTHFRPGSTRSSLCQQEEEGMKYGTLSGTGVSKIITNYLFSVYFLEVLGKNLRMVNSPKNGACVLFSGCVVGEVEEEEGKVGYKYG